QLSTPERLSAQAKLTITSSLYQPLALAARSGAAPIVGAVLSMLTNAGSEALLPALSSAVPSTVKAMPSVVLVCGPVQLATPERSSPQVKLTTTSVLFQPLALAAGAWTWLMVGEVRSILTCALLAASMLPALSTLQYCKLW